MKIIKLKDVKPVVDRRELFIGEVNRQGLVDTDIAQGLRVAMVHFSQGARSKLHTHTFEQVLYVTEGKGIIATDKEEHIATPGMVAFIPAGEAHWHGATKDSAFSHLAIMTLGETVLV